MKKNENKKNKIVANININAIRNEEEINVQNKIGERSKTDDRFAKLSNLQKRSTILNEQKTKVFYNQTMDDLATSKHTGISK